MEQWSSGIYLLGQYHNLRTGCWLLTQGNSGAILELPPYNRDQVSPAITARQLARQFNIEIIYLLCSHVHDDHFDLKTAREFTQIFPRAELWLQAGFAPTVTDDIPANYFDANMQLKLAGETLFLVHAPKHSWTDTMIIFRGAICTGDWELNTLRSVHNSVSDTRKLQSIETLIAFAQTYPYTIHTAFSVHANDRREHIDFVALMRDTMVDRKLW